MTEADMATDFAIAAGDKSKHAVTLVANDVTSFTFADNIGTVQIVSDGASAAYYTVDGSTPTVAGANTYLLPAGAASVDTRDTVNTAGVDIVRIISAGTPLISVSRCR